MFVYHRAPTGKGVRCWCIIELLQGRVFDVSVSQRSYVEGCYTFVDHSASTGKVIICSCILALLQGRLLYIRLS